jgi:hypothetical protein
VGQIGFAATVHKDSQQCVGEYIRRRRFTFFFADFSVLPAILCCVVIRRSCSLVLGGDTRFTRPTAVLVLRRPGRGALTGRGSAMVAPASGGCVWGFATTGAVGCSGLTGTNLGSIWRSQTGHHARLSSIVACQVASRRPAQSGRQMSMEDERDWNKHVLPPFS